MRPNHSGRAVSGPFAVAWFDPDAGRYLTETTASVSVEVVEPPRFDAMEIKDGTTEENETQVNLFYKFIVILLSICFVLSLAIGFAFVYVRSRAGGKGSDARRSASRLARVGRERGIGAGRAKTIDGLTSIFQKTLDRPPGALTPSEGRVAVESLAPADAELATLAERLLEDCDRVLFGGSSDSRDAESLAERGRELFGRLAEAIGTGREII